MCAFVWVCLHIYIIHVCVCVCVCRGVASTGVSVGLSSLEVSEFHDFMSKVVHKKYTHLATNCRT